MQNKLSVIIPLYNQEELIKRALDSIPNQDDIEIIVIDDKSTDNSLKSVIDYFNDTGKRIILLKNKENMGVGYTVNRGYDKATGEYVVLLGSDDYFIDLDLNELDGTDLIYFNLRVNNGDIWVLNEKTKHGYCGSTKFMRRAFIGDTRNPELRAGEDWYFYNKLLEKKPTEKFTNKTMKHYNFPRKGSLTNINMR